MQKLYSVEALKVDLQSVGWVERSETQHGICAIILCWVALHSTQPTFAKRFFTMKRMKDMKG